MMQEENRLGVVRTLGFYPRTGHIGPFKDFKIVNQCSRAHSEISYGRRNFEKKVLTTVFSGIGQQQKQNKQLHELSS